MKVWKLQQLSDGRPFWDSYLHPACREIKELELPDGQTPFINLQGQTTIEEDFI